MKETRFIVEKNDERKKRTKKAKTIKIKRQPKAFHKFIHQDNYPINSTSIRAAASIN